MEATLRASSLHVGARLYRMGTGSVTTSCRTRAPTRPGAGVARRYPRCVATPPDASITDARIRETIHALLDARREGATICPSDAARALRPEGDWRALMDDVRRVAGAETEEGRLEVRQQGQRVDLGAVRGPIRLARPD